MKANIKLSAQINAEDAIIGNLYIKDRSCYLRVDETLSYQRERTGVVGADYKDFINSTKPFLFVCFVDVNKGTTSGIEPRPQICRLANKDKIGLLGEAEISVV